MKRKVLFAVPAIFLSAGYPSPVMAQPSASTSYKYYEVTGESLLELRRDMMRRGPTAQGEVGYGVTTISQGRKMTVAACKSHGRYVFDAQFVIRLPKIAPTARLSGTERVQFSSFVSFVKVHEETHRTIWMKYIAKVDRQLQASGTSDCAAAHSRAMKLWREMMAGCRRLHTAFDKQQRGPLNAQPFVKFSRR